MTTGNILTVKDWFTKEFFYLWFYNWQSAIYSCIISVAAVCAFFIYLAVLFDDWELSSFSNSGDISPGSLLIDMTSAIKTNFS